MNIRRHPKRSVYKPTNKPMVVLPDAWKIKEGEPVYLVVSLHRSGRPAGKDYIVSKVIGESFMSNPLDMDVYGPYGQDKVPTVEYITDDKGYVIGYELV